MDASNAWDLLGPPDPVAACRRDLMFWLEQAAIMRERLMEADVTDEDELQRRDRDYSETEEYVERATRRLYAAEERQPEPAERLMGGLQ